MNLGLQDQAGDDVLFKAAGSRKLLKVALLRVRLSSEVILKTLTPTGHN